MGTFLGQYTYTFWYCAPKTASVMAVGRGEQCGTGFCCWLSHYEPSMHQRGHCQRDTEEERETETDLDKHLAPFYGKSKTVVCVHVAGLR